MKKGKTFFNVIIGIIVTALICAIGYAAYYFISNNIALSEAEEAVDEFENRVIVVAIEDKQEEEEPEEPEQTSSSGSSRTYYKGYTMVGTIQIPKTRVKAPIVDKITVNSISAAVGILYGPGLNEIGNTVLAAHNYRNRNIFLK